MSDVIRERQLAARKALKGEKAPAPQSTMAKQQKTVTLSGPSAEDQQAGLAPAAADDPLTEFLQRTRFGKGAEEDDMKMGNPFAFIPFNRLDLVLFVMLALALWQYVWAFHKIDLLPHLWYHIGPHYDHHDEERTLPPQWGPSDDPANPASSATDL